MITINDWYITTVGTSPYLPPDAASPCVGGVLDSDHPRGIYKAGDPIHTSAIVAKDGDVVRTAGGTEYRLGRISADYAAWLRENGHDADPLRKVLETTP
jgi:hypothetical protein